MSTFEQESNISSDRKSNVKDFYLSEFKSSWFCSGCQHLVEVRAFQGLSQDLIQPLQDIAQSYDDDVIIMMLTSLSWHQGKTWIILRIALSRQTCYIQVDCVEYWGLVHHPF